VAEEIIIEASADKEAKYQSLLPQIEALITDEPNLIANMANIAAALKEVFNFFWIGFYLVEDDTLVLGPFQGPIACTRISKGKGVCGKAWQDKRTVLVPNVDDFPGHIACSSGSKSEIVVPGIDSDGEVTFVLDVDSDKLDDFDENDRVYLNKVVELLT
jgi:L-methionine (R)-S-oxide reductase